MKLTISSMGRRGEGFANEIYVPYALPGETVTVEGERPRITSIEIPSPERVKPFCKYYGRCGGCQLQHWDEKPYRAWKRGLVESAMRVPVAELIDAHGLGRRRVSLHVRRETGVVTAGFMAARSHDLQDIDLCPILVPALARATEVARAIGEKLGDCDVAITASDTGLDVNARAERKIVAQESPKLAGLANALDLARLAVNGEVVATRRAPMLRMGTANIILPVHSFLQATAEGEAQLSALVMAATTKSKSVADLFCGCGPFALRMATRARVTAIDGDKPAIAALAHAARLTAGLKPIVTEVRDLMREPMVVSELKAYDTVIFDPPRAGAEAQSRQLAKSGVKTVIAVSCDPLSLARDASILIEGGYTLETVTPVDQFKWTSHVETVAVFQRRPSR